LVLITESLHVFIMYGIILKNQYPRMLRDKLTTKILSTEEKRKNSWDEIDKTLFRGQISSALVEGDIERGAVFAGPGAGMAKSITSAGEVVASLIDGYQSIIERMKVKDQIAVKIKNKHTFL
jgi:NAD(P)H-dependent flavin oxidoreductase YrpB (nitropropane dioxygenase family)